MLFSVITFLEPDGNEIYNDDGSMALRCGSFLEKTLKKKHLCRHAKNYYYFCKSNIPVITLIVDSRNMVKVS